MTDIDKQLHMQKVLENARDHKCDCGGELFGQAVQIKAVSKLITGGQNDAVIPISAYYCIKCHKPLDFTKEEASILE